MPMNSDLGESFVASPFVINVKDGIEGDKTTRYCDGPCGGLRFTSDLQLFGQCEHAVCPLCVANAPMIEGFNGQLRCCNTTCFLFDLANLVESPEMRQKYIRKLLGGATDIPQLFATYKPTSPRRTIENFQQITEILVSKISSLSTFSSFWDTSFDSSSEPPTDSHEETSVELTDSYCISEMPMPSSVDSSFTTTRMSSNSCEHSRSSFTTTRFTSTVQDSVISEDSNDTFITTRDFSSDFSFERTLSDYESLSEASGHLSMCS